MLGPELQLNKEFSLRIIQSSGDPSRAQYLSTILRIIIDVKLPRIQSFINSRQEIPATQLATLARQRSQMQYFNNVSENLLNVKKQIRPRQKLDNEKLEKEILIKDLILVQQRMKQFQTEFQKRKAEITCALGKLRKKYDAAAAQYNQTQNHQGKIIEDLKQVLDQYENWFHFTANSLSSIVPGYARNDPFQNPHLKRKLIRQQKYQRNVKIMQKKHKILADAFQEIFKLSKDFLQNVVQDIDLLTAGNRQPLPQDIIIAQIARIVHQAGRKLTLD